MTIPSGNGGFNGFDEFLIDSPWSSLVPSRSLRISSIPPRIRYDSEANLQISYNLTEEGTFGKGPAKLGILVSICNGDEENHDGGPARGGAPGRKFIPLSIADGVMNSWTRVLKAIPCLRCNAARVKVHKGVESRRLAGFRVFVL